MSHTPMHLFPRAETETWCVGWTGRLQHRPHLWATACDWTSRRAWALNSCLTLLLWRDVLYRPGGTRERRRQSRAMSIALQTHVARSAQQCHHSTPQSSRRERRGARGSQRRQSCQLDRLNCSDSCVVVRGASALRLHTRIAMGELCH